MYLTGTLKINSAGHLEIGGIDVIELVDEYGTPLWVIDEQGFRQNCAAFKNAFEKYGDCRVLYASKALCNMSICRIVQMEGLGLDVVSGGEIYTALKAGFPADKMYFHGNNKSFDEIYLAIQAGIGRIVVDNFSEMELLARVCREKGHRQDILLRITPGVEAHTHEFIMTGQIDSKFGFTLPGGQAMEAVKAALKNEALNLLGLHCHIGSQIFQMDSYHHSVSLMMDFMAEIKETTGHQFSELNMGGGFGIYYHNDDQPVQAEEWAKAVMLQVQAKAAQYGLEVPRVIVEPGRAIAGPAGITLYSVGTFKEVPGLRKYIAVDGGINDNPRPALYGSKYTAIIANKAGQEAVEKVAIAGKCCESGDMLIREAKLPKVESGDILAVFATGAYNYSMSSNYNRLPRPAMILVNNGKADVIVKRETYEDISRNDVLLDRLKI